MPQKAVYHPEIDTGIHIMQVIDYAANRGWPLATRLCRLTHDLGKGLTPADILPAHHAHEARSAKLVDALSALARATRGGRAGARCGRRTRQSRQTERHAAATVHDVLMRCDAIRRPERFVQC